jgi:hypothetical protein
MYHKDTLAKKEPEPPVEEEQPPPICAFFAGLEEAVDVGPHTLAQHLNHYERDVFIIVILFSFLAFF